MTEIEYGGDAPDGGGDAGEVGPGYVHPTEGWSYEDVMAAAEPIVERLVEQRLGDLTSTDDGLDDDFEFDAEDDGGFWDPEAQTRAAVQEQVQEQVQEVLAPWTEALREVVAEEALEAGYDEGYQLIADHAGAWGAWGSDVDADQTFQRATNIFTAMQVPEGQERQAAEYAIGLAVREAAMSQVKSAAELGRFLDLGAPPPAAPGSGELTFSSAADLGRQMDMRARSRRAS